MATLRIATWNVNGLNRHKRDVEILLKLHNIDVLLVSESHLTANQNLSIKNYVTYITAHPDGTAHAGTAVVIKKTIKHDILEEYKTSPIQATTVVIYDKNGSLTLSAIYCPPKHNIKEVQFTDYFKTLGHRFICGGDWNAKNVQWGSRLTLPRGRELNLSIVKNNLQTLSTGEPTYWPTDSNKAPDLIDFFIYKGLSNLYLGAESCLDTSSDHTPVIGTISTTIIERPAKDTLYNKHTDWDTFRSYINSNLSLNIALKTNDDIDDAAIVITNTIQTAAWISTPERYHNQGSKNLPKVIRYKVLEKRRLRRVWHSSRHPSDKKALNRAIVELRSYLKEIDDETLQNKLENLSVLGKNEYSLYKAVKLSKTAPTPPQHPLKLDKGSWARKDNERAKVFGEFLSEVFTSNNGDPDTNREVTEFLEADLQLSLPVKSCSPKEVYRVIRKLDSNKAPGFCLITAEVLQQLPKKAIVLITQLFNGIFRTAHYPYIWKISEIIMVPKPGKPPQLVLLYRPISLLPTLSKVFEK